jgi:phospholipid transport system substrate-binding protein
MTRTLRLSACLLALAAGLPALAGEDKAVTKPLQVVINAIRASKDSLALKQFAAEEQGKYLLGDEWAKGTDAQRKEFTELFQKIFAQEAFPKIRENFKNLDAVNYSNTVVNGDKAEADGLVVINHPLKKQELKLHFLEAKDGGAFKVVDVKVLGDSMLQGIRDDQIKPIFKDGGWDGLLKEMRDFLKKSGKQG